MHPTRGALATCFVGLAVAWVTTVVAWGSDGVTPRLYTNADLERFEAETGTGVIEPAGDSDADWRFVIEFLEREHARLDSQRAFELERLRLEARRLDPQPVDRSFRVPYLLPGCSPRPRLWAPDLHARHPQPLDGNIPLHARSAELVHPAPIVPLHARP